MTTRAAVRILVAGLVAAAALGAGVATTAHHPWAGTVRATGEILTLGPGDAPPGHPIDTEPACPNCFI